MSVAAMSRWKREFASFVRQHESRMLQFLIRKGVDPHESEDLCQEVFLTFWKNRDRAVPGKETQFLYGIARKVLQAHFRRKRDRPAAVDPDWIDIFARVFSTTGPLTDRENPGFGEDSDRRDGKIREALAVLPPRQKQVLELVWLEGLSRKDAAARMGITQGALRAHEKRALDRLRGLRRSD